MIGTSVSKSGKNIRLTKERWLHILMGHPELKEKEKEVLDAVRNPDFIAKGRADELRAVRKYGEKYLVVAYKEEKEGFILTAYITSRIKPVKKRGVIWPK